jgi:hypothetical protein
MSSTPQTGGFNIGQIPQIQYANPALFNPYGSLSSGITQGVETAGRLQDIQLRKAMNTRQQQQMEMEQQMQQARLNDIQYGVEQRPALEEERRLRLEELRRNAELNSAGQFGKMADAGQPHIYKDQDQEEKVINPQTGDQELWVRRTGVFQNGDPWHEFTPKKVLKTKEELQQEAELNKANVSYKTNEGEAAMLRAQNSQLAAQYKIDHPNAKTKTFSDENGYQFEQIIYPDGRLGAAVPVMLPDGKQAKVKASELTKTNAILNKYFNGETGDQTPVVTAPAAAGKAANPIAVAGVAAPANTGQNLYDMPAPKSPIYSQAMEWLAKNPNHPKAQAVRDRLFGSR